MITALWSAMNCFIAASGPAARSLASMKNSTGPATVSEPMTTNTAIGDGGLAATQPGLGDRRRRGQRERQVLGVDARERGAEDERLARR